MRRGRIAPDAREAVLMTGAEWRAPSLVGVLSGAAENWSWVEDVLHRQRDVVGRFRRERCNPYVPVRMCSTSVRDASGSEKGSWIVPERMEGVEAPTDSLSRWVPASTRTSDDG